MSLARESNMISMKQDNKRIRVMDASSSESITTSPVIRVGPIINPVSNETISIVIPLSASGELSGLPSRIITERVKEQAETKDDGGTTRMIIDERGLKLERSRASVSQQKEQSLILTTTTTTAPSSKVVNETRGKLAVPLLTSSGSSANQQTRADKTKGCPFPTCSRYGRAFSRAHDLKRHIARHETRKERLVESTRDDIRTCSQCGENFLNEAILQRHARIHSSRENTAGIAFQRIALPLVLATTSSITAQAPSLETTNESSSPRANYPCTICKKKYINEIKLKEHLLTHEKKSDSIACTLCGCQFDESEKLESHMREHTTSILQAHQEANSRETEKSSSRVIKMENMTMVKEEIMADDDDDDEFMLEEMLLLNKNPRLARPAGSSSSSSNNTSATSTSVTITASSSNNVGNNKIRCDYCSKTFKTKWTLSSHVAAHEGRFQFGCARCGKKFVRKSHFEGHVRSHEAARPYVCEQCGKTFKELKHRREHTKRKHPGNQNAIQNLLDSISACVSEESSVGEQQAKFTLLMPMNFGA